MNETGSTELLRPALRYKNPNSHSVHLIKFDDAYVPAGASYTMLVERSTRLALWSQKARAATIRRFERVMSALRQNPDFKLRCELSSAEAVEEARVFMQENGFSAAVLVGRAVDA